MTGVIVSSWDPFWYSRRFVMIYKYQRPSQKLEETQATHSNSSCLVISLLVILNIASDKRAIAILKQISASPIGNLISMVTYQPWGFQHYGRNTDPWKGILESSCSLEASQGTPLDSLSLIRSREAGVSPPDGIRARSDQTWSFAKQPAKRSSFGKGCEKAMAGFDLTKVKVVQP